MEDLKVVYWAENQVEADLICGVMKECGIPCKQMKESLGKSLGLTFGILGQIALAVPESRTAEAEAILIDWDTPIDEESPEGEETEGEGA